MKLLAFLLLACAALPCAALAQTSTDSVFVGFLATSSDPNKVGVGGKWDFDSPAYAGAISGTDSSQFWTFLVAPPHVDPNIFTDPRTRNWYFDYGNNINLGDHELWKARLAAGRVFRRTGLAGVWHADDMAGIAGSAPIHGSRSAWCGLRVPGDSHVLDELTGNAYDASQQLNDFRGPGLFTRSVYPGYGDMWDQMLYRDFATTGSPLSLSFRLRTHMTTLQVGDPNGWGWFTPDPTTVVNFVSNPSDSFMVWVGLPRPDGGGSGVYDRVRKWLSEVLRFDVAGGGRPQKLFAVRGKVPAAGSDTTIQLQIPDFSAFGDSVRVVFRVKTDRFWSDLAWNSGAPFNSIDGAALVDDVNVGGVTSDFESPQSVRPRALLGPAGQETLINPGTTWITTGRPPPRYGHIHNAFNLPYHDPSGGIGDPGRICNLTGNILLMSNHDDPHHSFVPESQNWSVSPTICLSGPRAAAQGIPPTLRSEMSKIVVRFDLFPGDGGNVLSTGVLLSVAMRYMGTGAATSIQPAAPTVPAWTIMETPSGADYTFGDAICRTFDNEDPNYYLPPWANIDSLQIGIQTQVRCARFGATACGADSGSYYDNIQVLFVRDQPFTGVEPGASLDFVHGAFPNPSADGMADVVFELSRAVPVTARFYDLRGRLVHEARIAGTAGLNHCHWDGTMDSGSRVGSGVYFYRLYAGGVEFRNNANRLVFVGRE